MHSSAKTSIIHRRATLPRPAVSKHRTSDVQQPQRDYSCWPSRSKGCIADSAFQSRDQSKLGPCISPRGSVRWHKHLGRTACRPSISPKPIGDMGRGVSERSTQMNSNLEVHAMLHVPEELRRLIGETCELLNRLDRLPSVVASEHVQLLPNMSRLSQRGMRSRQMRFSLRQIPTSPIVRRSRRPRTGDRCEACAAGECQVQSSPPVS